MGKAFKRYTGVRQQTVAPFFVKSRNEIRGQRILAGALSRLVDEFEAILKRAA